jgi:MFS family permease
VFQRQHKVAIFVLEGLNSWATTYYFYYLYFFTKQQFGFGPKQNLLLAAVLGLICAFTAIYAGGFAQRRGYFLALKIGFATMAASICTGLFLQGLAGHIAVAMVATFGMCFTWPTMQAMISEGESRVRLQKLLGFYNLTWAGAGAAAYFVSGAILERLGPASMFYIPATIHALQLAITFWLQRSHTREAQAAVHARVPGVASPQIVHAEGKTFLHMAWLANPFAYLAINTLIPVIPDLAKSLHFSPAMAGVFCSVWFFVRAASFEVLRWWPGWHYRFGWLVFAFLGMIASFAALLLLKSILVLLVAQVVFGISVGLIYYSSLFYSMDVGETKGEHGGLHEGMIGVGSCAGPAIGALTLSAFPNRPDSGSVVVTALLICGFFALLILRKRPRLA